MRNGIVDDASGALERLDVDPTAFDMTGKVLIEDVPDDLTGLRWDTATRAFVEDVEGRRAARWAEVKALRDVCESGGAATPLGTVDSDPVSIGRITGAVVMAQVALSAEAPFSIDWTMADNSVVAHDAAAMIAMGVAVGAHVDAVHARARTLRAALDEAASIAALDAIDITTGWPT